MKTMKKITSLVLALAMVMTMSVGVFAADKVTIKINGTTGHTYEAYQVFSGRLDDASKEPTDAKLSNIKWGNGITQTGWSTLGDPKEYAKSISGLSADQLNDKSKEIAKYLDAANAIELTETDNWTKEVETGYYLIQETNVPAGQTASKYMVRIVTDKVIEPKVTSDVEFGKKIMDVNDTTEEQLTTNETQNAADPKWQDSADYDIGDKVPFKLSAKVASDASKYAGPYKLEFVDQLSPELTPVLDNTGKLAVVVKVNGNVIPASKYVVAEEMINGAKAFKVTFADVNKIAEINDGDVVNVFLSATLNETAKIGATTDNLNKAKLRYSNNPTSTQTGDDVPTTETPWDTVRVFTYEYDAHKIDGDTKEALVGAGFTLYKVMKDGTEKEIKVYKADDRTVDFIFKGLDDGKYILKETETPSGYNTIEPITFVITADHPEESADPQLGTVKFTKQLADNKTEEIPNTTGLAKENIENLSGLTLPETGGMGTTVLYVLGAMLALGAAVLLVTKKIVGQK